MLTPNNHEFNISKSQIEKIGNLLIYLSSKLDNLFLTKLLKLLYLIDETSIKESGVPVTWLEYKVWEKGPVASQVYNDIKWENTNIFGNYIDIEIIEDDYISYRILPKLEFDDSEFSDYEIEIIDKIIEAYKDYTGTELINALHKENTIWHRIVKEKNLEIKFKLFNQNTSPYKIDLSELIKNDPMKLDHYLASKEGVEFYDSL